MTAPHDYIARPVDDLPTPAMCVDVDDLDYNIKLLDDYFRDRRCKLRPHWKSNKCAEIARRQMAAGSAVGITAAKLAEAEQLVAAGIADVLIANQVVGPDKADRLAELNRRAAVRVAVDDPTNVAELGAAASRLGVSVGVLVEVDIGMGRCGVAPGAAIELAERVHTTPGLRFDGLQGYEGHLVLLADADEKRRKVTEAVAGLVATRRAIESAGLPVRIVSGGGTGTYDITGNIAGVDEIQAGSYALMDACYKKLRPQFRNAMFVLSTVISARAASGSSRAIVDVGVKGLGCEFGPPVVASEFLPSLGGRAGQRGTLADKPPVAHLGSPAAPIPTAVKMSEEHTFIDNLPARVGQKVRLIPSHGCTTSNLHRRLWAIRNGRVEACWPIEGSGCLE